MSKTKHKDKHFCDMTREEKVADLRRSASIDERMSDSYEQRASEESNPRMAEFYSERATEYMNRAEAWNNLADEYERGER